jgi:hypothetical protein
LYDITDLVYSNIRLGFADISIGAHVDVSDVAKELLSQVYQEVSGHILAYPDFGRALSPLEVKEEFCLPGDGVLSAMYEVSQIADVGPMASVAGAIAQYIGRGITAVDEIIVENGGDLYLRCMEERVVLVYAGNSPLSLKIGIKIPRGEWGVCTSSGTFGHSLSFGCADAALVVSHDATLADAVATALGNRIIDANSLEVALEYAIKIPGVIGVLGIVGEVFGVVGDIELVSGKATIER